MEIWTDFLWNCWGFIGLFILSVFVLFYGWPGPFLCHYYKEENVLLQIQVIYLAISFSSWFLDCVNDLMVGFYADGHFGYLFGDCNLP